MSYERVNIEVEKDIDFYVSCRECDKDLKFELEFSKYKDKLYIQVEPCSNCCKKEDEEK